MCLMSTEQVANGRVSFIKKCQNCNFFGCSKNKKSNKNTARMEGVN